MTGPPDIVRAWLEKASHDLTAARYLLESGDSEALDAAVFHAQQCAEKSLKTALVFHSVDPPRTHDLVVLMRLVPGSPPSVSLERLASLNRHAVESRYPGLWEAVSRIEADEAVADAALLYEWARSVVA